MPITLFPDQEYLVQQALELTNNGTKHENVMITSPSGSGKTFIIAGLIKKLIDLGFEQKDFLVISPTYEVAEQIHNRIKTALDVINHEIPIMGSVKTSRLEDVEQTTFKFILIDEAHHTEANTYKKTISKFPEAIVFGFTATPMRNDDKELSNTFQHLLSGLSIQELIKAKRLADYEYIIPKTDNMPIMSDYLDILGLQFHSENKRSKLDRIIYGDIISTWLKYAKDRQTIVFAPKIEESKLIAEEFQMFGINAAHVDGSTMDSEVRFETIKKFRDGKIQVLCNFGLVSEGFDVPNVSCVVLARQTHSVIQHLQQCFRAMRIGNDLKQKAIILDHVNNASQFGKLDVDRGWSLTMDDAQKALARTGKDTRSKKKAKDYDINYSTMTEAEMINLANVKSPFFDADVKKVLEMPKSNDIEKLKTYKAMVDIQKKYKIVSGKNMPTWSAIMAVRFGFATGLIAEHIKEQYPNLIF